MDQVIKIECHRLDSHHASVECSECGPVSVTRIAVLQEEVWKHWNSHVAAAAERGAKS